MRNEAAASGWKKLLAFSYFCVKDRHSMAAGTVFISHIEEDEASATTIAHGLEAAGFTTWYFGTRNNPGFLPGSSPRCNRTVRGRRRPNLAIFGIGSHQMTKEVVRAHETGKPFIPVRFNISHAEFQRRQPEWSIAMGAASSIPVPVAGVAAIVPRIVMGLRQLQVPGAAESPEGSPQRVGGRGRTGTRKPPGTHRSS